MEMRVAEILAEQEYHGWAFDERAAQELEQTLRQELHDVQRRITARHPYVSQGVFTPRVNNKTRGYVKGAPSTRVVETNVTSRDHITWILGTFYGWKPTKLTDKGKPVMDEVVLKELGTDFGNDVARCLELSKSLGMLSEGKNAWLKLVRDGRIHHNCCVSTNTHRCAHRNPNLAQVPSDERFRRLFISSPGYNCVGADLAGIELRMLAHYLARYDEGRYADVLLNGDIHQVNADRIGISRKAVKTVTYAFLYGAGDTKIGLSVDSTLKPQAAAKVGKEIRQAYMDAIDGLEKLVTGVKQAVEKRGLIKIIDGRQIKVESSHKVLNYLLQCGAGVVAKRWMLNAYDNIKQHGIDAHQLAFIHDELQYECYPTYVNDLKFQLLHAAQLAGEQLGMRIPIAAEAKAGASWADCH